MGPVAPSRRRAPGPGWCAGGVALALALGSAARAHVPHDDTVALAVPADLDPDGTWYLLGSPGQVSLFYKSRDGGRSWDMMGGAPVAFVATHAALHPDGTVLFAGDARLLWTADEGVTWQHAEIDETITGLAALGGRVLVGTPTGALIGPTPLSLSDDPGPASVAALFAGRDAVLALDAEGGLWRRDASAWAALEGPDSTLTAAVAGQGEIYVGDADGQVWRREEGGDWTACGALDGPPDDRGWYPHIAALAIDDDGAVLAAPAWSGPFASFDRCATFEDRHAPSLDVDYDSATGAEGWEASFTGLVAGQGAWVASGWHGVARSTDGGLSWTKSPTVPPDFTRGLAVAPDYEESGEFLLGTYAAAVALVTDGGASVDADLYGISAANAQRTYYSPFDPQVLYALAAHAPWRSTDRGRSWTALDDGFVTTGQLVFLDEPQRIWAAASSGLASGHTVAESTDDGESWHDVLGLGELLGAAELLGAVQLQHGGVLRTVVVAKNPLIVAISDDAGASWRAVLSGDDVTATAPVAWPAQDPERLLFAASFDLVVSTDGGETWTREPATVHITSGPSLVRADDDTLLAWTRTSELLRSDDGGETWTTLEATFPGPVQILVPVPGFAAHGEVLVGTYDGVYLVRDAHDDAPTLSRWTAWQRVDDSSPFFQYEPTDAVPLGCPEVGAMVGTTRVEAGQRAVTAVRGQEVRLYGAVEDGGAGRLLVDDEVLAEWSGDAAEATVDLLATSGSLADGWHFVAVEGTLGRGVLLDAVEGWGQGTRLLAATAPEVDDAHRPWGTLVPATQEEASANEPERARGCWGRAALLLLLPAGLRRRRGWRVGASGGTPLNLFQMARRGLRLELRGLVSQAVREGRQVSDSGLVASTEEGEVTVDVVVRPLPEAGSEAPLFLVVFQEPPPWKVETRRAPAGGTADSTIVQQLEQDLRDTREHLRATVEDLESANEQLTSSNEELVSMNEELQASNEELQTSKEELQSMNEELHTVNTELQRNMAEVRRANNDLRNLLESTNLAVLIFGRDLHLLRFTPAAAALFHLAESDLGRSITALDLGMAGSNIYEDAHHVLDAMESTERPVHLPGGTHYVARALPYRNVEGSVDGVLVTFVDVTALRLANERQAELAAIVASSHDAVVALGPDLVIRHWNAAAERMYGYTAAETIGRNAEILWPPPTWDEVRGRIFRVLRGEVVAPYETLRRTKHGATLHVSVTLSPIHDDAGLVIGISSISRDVGEQHRLETERAELDRRL